MKNTKRNVIVSAILTIALCVSLMAGGTYAWFTDTAETKVNTIVSGKLDVALDMKSGDEWVTAESKTLNFVRKNADGEFVEDAELLWEPGATYELPELRVRNADKLALKYRIDISGAKGDIKLLDVITFTAKVGETTVLSAYGKDIYEGELKAGEFDELKVSATMNENADNEYAGLKVRDIYITVYATQATYEYDVNGNDYDADATYLARKAMVFNGVEGVVDMNTFASGYDGVIYAQNGAKVTINADIKAEDVQGYAMAVWAVGENTVVTIKGGEFTQLIHGNENGVVDNQYDLIYAMNGAKVVIEDGTFKVGAGDPKFTLNVLNSNPGTIEVKGGKFWKYDPATGDDNLGGSFLADGYKSVADGDWFVVVPED